VCVCVLCCVVLTVCQLQSLTHPNSECKSEL